MNTAVASDFDDDEPVYRDSGGDAPRPSLGPPALARAQSLALAAAAKAEAAEDENAALKAQLAASPAQPKPTRPSQGWLWQPVGDCGGGCPFQWSLNTYEQLIYITAAINRPGKVGGRANSPINGI